MKIVHAVRETSHGSLSYADLTSGGRGATGSEQSMLYTAMYQAQVFGHEVSVYLPTDTPGIMNGVECLDVRSSWPRLKRMDKADVIISWTTADLLRDQPDTKLRLYNPQINDWWTNGYDYQKWVDSFIFVSEAHRQHLLSQTGNPGKDCQYDIIPNGTDYLMFSQRGFRVPKRCVYLSSPDRGLHWLLYLWPIIHQAHPDAELHIYYEIQKWIEGAILLTSEVGVRARYVAAKLNSGLPGVTVHGAVSPRELAAELSACSLMLYPADTVRWTEGFGNAVMDACAAGVFPIITDCDAFGEVYAHSGASVVERGNSREWLDEFMRRVLYYLSNPQEVEAKRQVVQDFASKYDWKEVASKWQEIIERRTIEKQLVISSARHNLKPDHALPAGGTGPPCSECGLGTWVELGGGDAVHAYHPNIDIREMPGVDIVLNIGTELLPFHDNHADRVKMMHSLNHLSYMEGRHVLKESFRILKPNGLIFIMVTDLDYLANKVVFNHLDEETLVSVYGTRGNTYDADYHKWGYNFVTLARMLREVGFSNIEHVGWYNAWEFKVIAEKPNEISSSP